MKQVSIDEFMLLARQLPVLDVRSPAEYEHAHIPGAYSLPLFTDEQRKVVGILYKQEGQQQAIKSGLDYFGPRMRTMVEEVELIVQHHKSIATRSDSNGTNAVLVHCWRGGMRSAGVAWLLDLYGFKVNTLKGGYKTYRNYVLNQFSKSYNFRILGGHTGSGKTELLHYLQAAANKVIDLEGLAHHKGSAFGDLGEEKQPGQEMFENILASELYEISSKDPQDKPIWIEDESRRIGLVNLPESFWQQIRNAPLYFLDVPFAERLGYITAGYGRFNKEDLANAIKRIQKRLGGLNTKNALQYLNEDNFKECFGILLQYYDKFYKKGLAERIKGNMPVHTITCEIVNAESNSNKLPV